MKAINFLFAHMTLQILYTRWLKNPVIGNSYYYFDSVCVHVRVCVRVHMHEVHPSEQKLF